MGSGPEFLSESVLKEKPRMDSFVAPDPLCFLESEAAEFEGASHDLFDYLRLGVEPQFWGQPEWPCRVPGGQEGRQPVPGREKVRSTSAWRGA